MSYRPESDLLFLSNLINKVVAERTEHRLRVNDLHDSYQSTETAPIKAHSDITK